MKSATPSLPTDFRVSQHGPYGVHLTWTGVFGRGYRIERSFDLQPESWQPLGAAGGDDGFIDFVDPEPADHPQAFYRILPSL